MLISMGGLVQWPASAVRENIVEPVKNAALDGGELPVNILSRHSSFSSSGNLSTNFPSA